MNIDNNHFGCMYIPTFRIIMTNECNGECFFCHREGNSLCTKSACKMELNIIENDIIPTVNKIGINKVIFTGGEPTMHKDIAISIEMIKDKCQDVQVGITTNGYNLNRLQCVKNDLDRITISLSSLKKEIFMRYTKKNPFELIEQLQAFIKTEKSVSIVITKENVNELEEMIDFCIDKNFDVKLQFIISNSEKEDIYWKRKVLYTLIKRYGKFEIKLGTTPTLYRNVGEKKIKIKLASLNAWMYDNLFLREICVKCERKNECVERGCSVRIFPDGRVTSCLNQYITFSSINVQQNILDAYDALKIKALNEP